MPKQVRVAGQIWRITVKPRNEDGDYGECDRNERTIYLYSEPHSKYGQDMKSTLLHELCHAALTATGATHICGGEDKEEAIVSALELVLWPLIDKGLFSSSSI